MRKYTAGELEECAKSFDKSSRAYDVYMELARRLRQDAEENRRDPVTDPRVGDRIIFECGDEVAWSISMDYPKGREDWKQWATRTGSTIVRRREVP